MSLGPTFTTYKPRCNGVGQFMYYSKTNYSCEVRLCFKFIFVFFCLFVSTFSWQGNPTMQCSGLEPSWVLRAPVYIPIFLVLYLFLLARSNHQGGVETELCYTSVLPILNWFWLIMSPFSMSFLLPQWQGYFKDMTVKPYCDFCQRKFIFLRHQIKSLLLVSMLARARGKRRDKIVCLVT